MDNGTLKGLSSQTFRKFCSSKSSAAVDDGVNFVPFQLVSCCLDVL